MNVIDDVLYTVFDFTDFLYVVLNKRKKILLLKLTNHVNDSDDYVFCFVYFKLNLI